MSPAAAVAPPPLGIGRASKSHHLLGKVHALPSRRRPTATRNRIDAVTACGRRLTHSWPFEATPQNACAKCYPDLFPDRTWLDRNPAGNKTKVSANLADSPKRVHGQWVIVRSLPGAGTFISIALTDHEVEQIKASDA